MQLICASWGRESGHLSTNCICHVLCSYPLPWAICSPALSCDSGFASLLEKQGDSLLLCYIHLQEAPTSLLWPLPSSKSGLSSNFRVGNAYGNLILTSPYLGDRGSGSGRVDASLLNFLCGRRETGSVLLTEDQGAPFSVFLWWRLFPFLGKDFFRPYRSYLYLFPTLPPTMSTCIKYLEMPKIKISLYPRMTFYDSFSSTDRWDYSKHGKLKVLPWRSPLQVVSHSKINIVKILQLIPHWCMMAISRFWFTVR